MSMIFLFIDETVIAKLHVIVQRTKEGHSPESLGHSRGRTRRARILTTHASSRDASHVYVGSERGSPLTMNHETRASQPREISGRYIAMWVLE